ncbi:poly [ADP-ribose] polymerase 14-like, partial [Paramuricea clavata]
MYFSGYIAEHMDIRFFLTGGMILSGTFSILFGLGYFLKIHSLAFFIIMQLLAGLAQSSGWPAVVEAIGNWFGKGQRGLIMGIWNSHTSVGNIAGSAIAAVWSDDKWGWSFIVPGFIIIAAGLLVFFFLVVDPSHVDCNPPQHHVKPRAASRTLNGEESDSDSTSLLNNYTTHNGGGPHQGRKKGQHGADSKAVSFFGAKKALDTSPHSLDGSTLTTRQKKVENFANDKVFVEGISIKTSKDSLKFYMERISGSDVKDITYDHANSESRNAIVTFHSSIDFDKIQEGFRKKPTLEEKHISIKTVPVCKTILVKNLPTTATYDSVFYKFENKRAGGGEIQTVNLDLEKRIALVEFKDTNVIDQVLSVKQTLDNTTPFVERYHPILGSLADLQSTEQEISEPTRREVPTAKPRHPKAAGFTEDIDRDLYFYLKDNLNPTQLSLALKDPQPDIEVKKESVHFTFSTQVAKEHFLDYLKGFKCKIIPVNPVLTNQGLSEEIEEIISVFSLVKSVSFIKRYNEGFIKLVGRAVPTFDRAIDEVKKCIDKVEERTNQRKDVLEILPVHLKLLQRLETSLKRGGCEIQLDDTKGRIIVKGSQTQIQKLKNETQDIIGHFGERLLKQSKFSLLKIPKGLSHVKTLFPTENLIVEVLINDQGNVMLYGMDQTQVQQAYNMIENAIGEMKLPQRLKTKVSQDALLNELGASIPFILQTEEGEPRIVCFKKNLRNLSGKMDDFLERKKTVDKRVPLSKIVLRYLDLHGGNLFDGLRMSSPGSNIVIGSDALVVSGERPLVDNCCTSIQQFTRGLKFHSMNYGTPETAAVDYLVNPANEEMKHSGGLAKAIVDKGGKQIQEDCSRALQDHGRVKLMPGEVVTTDGGSLMCKKVLHVVVPNYRPTPDGDEHETREEMYLRHCCTTVLGNATDGQTIAIPALGTGSYRVPRDVSAKSLVRAANEFLQGNPTHALREVHFVDNNSAAVEALMKEMTTRFGHDPNFQINELVRDRWRSYLGAANDTSSSASVVSSRDMAFKTPEGMEIKLTVGNIAKSTTDVIVNTVANDLNLTRNPCSRAILQEAGSEITTFCERWVNNNGQLQGGHFATTDGAKLKCKKVFHVCCPKWTPSDGEKILRQLAQELLAQVQTLFLTTISIPALGTGNLNFPEALVAKVLFEEGIKFSSKQSSSFKIRLYNIVVYSGNTKAVDIFKEQFQIYSGKKIETLSNVPKTKRMKSILFGTRKSPAKEESSDDETHGVNVEIVQGNIVHESTDAIGFLVIGEITQGGQIGQALLDAGGASLKQEYSKLNNIEAQSVVMTAAGTLKARNLLHMVTKRNAPKDKSLLQKVVTKCLDHADSCGFTSLSLPAVGTGDLKKDAEQSAEILYNCIKKFRKGDVKSLKLIRIVILKQAVYTDFSEAYTRKDPTPSTNSRGTRRTRQRITLEIVAESSSDITKIKEELRQVEAEQSHSETIEVRHKLDDRQLAEILEVQDRHGVRIECEPAIGFIRISGLAKNVSNGSGEIHRIIYAWEQDKHHTDATVREVQWFYYETNVNVVIPEKYPDNMSAKIERTYKNDPSGSVVVGEEIKYKIDFKTMTERCLDPSENETMKVYRRPCEEQDYFYCTSDPCNSLVFACLP